PWWAARDPITSPRRPSSLGALRAELDDRNRLGELHADRLLVAVEVLQPDFQVLLLRERRVHREARVLHEATLLALVAQPEQVDEVVAAPRARTGEDRDHVLEALLAPAVPLSNGVDQPAARHV